MSLQVFADAHVVALPWFDDAAWLPDVADVVHVDPRASVEAVRACAERMDSRLTPVAVGGGSVLDVAGLAGAGVIGLERGRSGLVTLPAGARPSRVVAVPTTLGTGAETSASACVLVGDRRRLVVGTALRARAVVHHEPAFASLPAAHVGEAIFEVVMRLVAPYVGSAPTASTDALAESLLRELIALARADEVDRMQLASVSALSHAGEMCVGREPFSAKLWYVANELAELAGLRKMPAQRLLLGAWLRRVAAGDARWGSAARLDDLTGRLGEDDGWLVVLGEALVAPPATVPADLVADAARRAARAWGAGQPMLAGLSERDIRVLLSEALG